MSSWRSHMCKHHLGTQGMIEGYEDRVAGSRKASTCGLGVVANSRYIR
jgi:hypothetical protein